MRFLSVAGLLLGLAFTASADPPPIPKCCADGPPVTTPAVKDGDALIIPAGKYADITFDLPAGAKVTTRYLPPPTQKSKGLAPGRLIFAGTGTIVVLNTIIDFDKKEQTQLDFTVTFGPPTPPPVPPVPPGPKPPDPKPPGPVTSFRVIFVLESGVRPPPGQVAVSDAKTVRDYLDAKSTKEGGQPGYRRYDPDANTTNEQPTMKDLWAAVKPKLTAVPCLVVEVNGKADILPYPANAAECLTLLKKYAEGN